MAEITAALVKELRERTGAGMMDCKRALAETDGDIEAAADWLRTKGLAAAAKKSGRVAAEGLVAAVVDGTKGAVVEVNSETDFVARNSSFQELVLAIAGVALENDGDFDRMSAAPFPGEERTVAEQVTHMVGTIGENLQLRRSFGLSVGQGVVVNYVHNAVVPGAGSIAVLVGLESAGDAGALTALAKQIAMHIAATNPKAISAADLDPQVLEKERKILSDQARESGKPEEIIEKMVEGRIRKFQSEVVLTEQVFVIDNETKISAVLENAGKDLGSPVSVAGFARFELGEGIEKKEEDFAAEVAAQTRK
ncbi:MAG: elongation factor Ts [Alphaproteobacteria bacterium]|nr:elongation factor Ts [Alphaproteobacteria bacterium]